MYKLSSRLTKIAKITEASYKQWKNLPQIRNISALYISGDKAKENYVVLQPFMDFKQTFENVEELENSIKKRKLSIDMKKVGEMFAQYKQHVKEIDMLEDEREMVSKKLKELSKLKNNDEDLINQLKEKGKQLRNEMKALKVKLYPIEEEFIKAFLHLPNFLHRQCPEGDFERIIYRSEQPQLEAGKAHLESEKLIHFIDNSRYYMMEEAAEFDYKCTYGLTKYFLEKGGFIQTANPDFTRLVLLEANATPMDHYHKVMEQHVQNNLNAAYLTGGASFESFLGAVTKLCVFPSVLPLKYVSGGRLYEKTTSQDAKPSLYTATQTNAVTTFVATTTPTEAEEQMDSILNLCVDFYKIFNVHFRVVYVNAAQLTESETLRAQIEIYSPHEKRYICVGRVSNYTDFVSKRILFTMRQQKDYKFLHLVGGPVLYTSRLIAALIEHQEPLDYAKVLEALTVKDSSHAAAAANPTNAINDFKSLFK